MKELVGDNFWQVGTDLKPIAVTFSFAPICLFYLMGHLNEAKQGA